MEATIQYTTEFFDNLSKFRKHDEKPQPVEVLEQLYEPESNEILSDYPKIPNSPYSPILYTRTEHVSDQVEQP